MEMVVTGRRHPGSMQNLQGLLSRAKGVHFILRPTGITEGQPGRLHGCAASAFGFGECS